MEVPYMREEITKRVAEYLSIYYAANCFLVIPCPSTSGRKELHLLLEEFVPWVSKTSYKCKNLPKSDDRSTRLRCFNCENSKSWPATYHYGCMDNNQDEYYTADCRDCGERTTWEPNYDDHDDVVRLYRNNCIVLGSYFRSYQNNSERVKNWEKNQNRGTSDAASLTLPLLEFLKTNHGQHVGIPVVVKKDFEGLMKRNDLKEWFETSLSEATTSRQ